MAGVAVEARGDDGRPAGPAVVAGARVIEGSKGT